MIKAIDDGAKGYLLDAFPLNLDQAKAFEEFIGTPSKLIYLSISQVRCIYICIFLTCHKMTLSFPNQYTILGGDGVLDANAILIPNSTIILSTILITTLTLTVTLTIIFNIIF